MNQKLYAPDGQNLYVEHFKQVVLLYLSVFDITLLDLSLSDKRGYKLITYMLGLVAG